MAANYVMTKYLPHGRVSLKVNTIAPSSYSIVATQIDYHDDQHFNVVKTCEGTL